MREDQIPITIFGGAAIFREYGLGQGYEPAPDLNREAEA